MSSLTVRPASADDAGALASLLSQLGYPVDPADIPRRLAALNATPGSIALVLCDADGRVVGAASGARFVTLHRDPPTAYITALVTEASARRQGVGRILIAALEDWARKAGCARLSVTSAEARTGAHAFYEHSGMPYSGRRFTMTL